MIDSLKDDRDDIYDTNVYHMWYDGYIVCKKTAQIIKEIKWDIKQGQENRIKNIVIIGNPLLELIARLEKEEESNLQEDGEKVV